MSPTIIEDEEPLLVSGERGFHPFISDSFAMHVMEALAMV
jgi:hypothetical protein